MRQERRALLLEPPTCYGADSFARLMAAGVDVAAKECESRDELIHVLLDARRIGRPYRALFVKVGLPIDAGVFSAASGALRHVVTPTTGLEHIDLVEAEKRSIRVLSLKDHVDFLRTITSTGELTMALLLALVRRLPLVHSDVLSGNWRRAPFPGRELRGMTMGILGLGRLGSLVGGYARAFGMRVLAYDYRAQPFADPSNADVQRRDVDDLLANSDVVSLHLPLAEDTAGILDRRRIKLMKRGAVLINTSRGELVDEAALLSALEEGAIAGCGLDVLAGDSHWNGRVPEDHPLVAYAREHDNVLLSPHIGGYTVDAVMRTRSFMVERFCEELDRESRTRGALEAK